MDIRRLSSRRCIICHQVAVPNIHAPRKGRFTVYHEDFSVIAQINVKSRRNKSWRNKPGDRQAPLPDALARKGAPADFSDAVNENPYQDTATVRPLQGLNKTAARLIHIEDIGGQKNGKRGLINCLQHGRIGFFSVVEQGDMISRTNRIPADAIGNPCLGQILGRQVGK